MLNVPYSVDWFPNSSTSDHPNNIPLTCVDIRRKSFDVKISSTKHDDCIKRIPLVGVWVILDRPPNDPFLRKKEPLTSSFRTNCKRRPGVMREAGYARI